MFHLLCIVVVVGGDDTSHQFVAYHVGAGEVAEGDVVDTGQDSPYHPQTRLHRTGKVGLGDVAGDDDLRPEPQSGEEHLHLLWRGVLGLVEDDEGVVEGTTTHVRQRSHLDGTRVHEPGDGVRTHHVAQRVMERTQVRVDLLGEGTGQESHLLTGLHCWTGEDDPAHLPGMQCLHRLGHGQIRLPGTGRANPEDDGVGIHGVDVTLLVAGLGADDVTVMADDVGRHHLRRGLALAGHGDDAIDVIDAQ